MQVTNASLMAATVALGSTDKCVRSDKPLLPYCKYYYACKTCKREFTEPLEKDPDERIMPHDWVNVNELPLKEMYPGLDWSDVLPHELFCKECKAVWDPVPGGKEKLL